MKKNEKRKLHELSYEELRKRSEQTKQELANLRLQKASGKLKDLHAYAKKRNQNAKLLTIMKEKEPTTENI